jgi:hypothetical protein
MVGAAEVSHTRPDALCQEPESGRTGLRGHHPSSVRCSLYRIRDIIGFQHFVKSCTFILPPFPPPLPPPRVSPPCRPAVRLLLQCPTSPLSLMRSIPLTLGDRVPRRLYNNTYTYCYEADTIKQLGKLSPSSL